MNELSSDLPEVFGRKTEQEFPQWGRKYKDGVQAYQRLLGCYKLWEIDCESATI
jgi:hypothetical protein